MTPRFADLTWRPDDQGRADCCEQASADLPNGWRVTFLRGQGRNASIHMDPSSRPYEICPWSPDGTPCPDEIEGDWPMQGDAEEMQRLMDLVAAQGPPIPEGDVPLPAPPGTGEVLALDPFPKLARSIEETPPLRDNGRDAPAAAADAPVRLRFWRNMGLTEARHDSQRDAVAAAYFMREDSAGVADAILSASGEVLLDSGALDAAMVALEEEWRQARGLPQPRQNPGGEPCGECHLTPAEVCDICGAVAKP